MKKLMLVMFGLLIALTPKAFAGDADLELEVGMAVEAVASSQAQPTLTQEVAATGVPANDCETESFLVPSFLEETTPKSAGWTLSCGSCGGPCANRSVVRLLPQAANFPSATIFAKTTAALTRG